MEQVRPRGGGRALASFRLHVRLPGVSCALSGLCLVWVEAYQHVCVALLGCLP